jgi:glycine cleavage system H protein
MIRYSKEHVWVRVEGDTGVVGITVHAQDTLGDIVFVQAPAVGTQLTAGDVAGVYSPVSGTVTAINDALSADPSLVNSDPLGQGWLYKLQLSQTAELDALLDDAAYAAFSAS